jgi:hypothetical protein
MALLSASVMFSSISKGAKAARPPCNGRSQAKNAPINRYTLKSARQLRGSDEHLPESDRVGFAGVKQLFSGLLIHVFVGDIHAAECCFQHGSEHTMGSSEVSRSRARVRQFRLPRRQINAEHRP